MWYQEAENEHLRTLVKDEMINEECAEEKTCKERRVVGGSFADSDACQKAEKTLYSGYSGKKSRCLLRVQ